VMTHGWPGSVVELLDVIGPLTDPEAHGGSAADAFHLVVPSLPGYGFSDKPTEPGWNVPHIAAAWGILMERLGYQRYAAQGGDWGSMVTTAIGSTGGDRVIGIHLNMPITFPGPDDVLTPIEEQIIADMTAFMKVGSGYVELQSTHPQTLGYGLVDSPVGQAAWIAEKLWDWSDNGGDLSSVLSFDQVLDNVMHYWLPGTGASSARLYWEARQAQGMPTATVPVGISVFPKELYRTTQRWAARTFPGLQYFNELDKGGHFAAWEQPTMFVDEVRASFRGLRAG
jgi:epoxide hydrolase